MSQETMNESTEQKARPPAGVDLAAIPGRMMRVIVDPMGFYREMPKSGGLAEPLVFVAAMAVTMALLMAILGLIGFGPVGMLAMGFFGVIVLPIFAVIGSFIAGGVLFLIWKLMGSNEDFEAAYRCAAYAYAFAPVAAVVSGIPYIGTIIRTLWPMALLAIASIQVHGLSPKLSWGVFGVIGLLLAFSSLSMEFTVRHLGSDMNAWSRQMEKKYGNADEMTPEEAGKAVGDFLKGLQQMQQQGGN